MRGRHIHSHRALRRLTVELGLVRLLHAGLHIRVINVLLHPPKLCQILVGHQGRPHLGRNVLKLKARELGVLMTSLDHVGGARAAALHDLLVDVDFFIVL